MRANVLLLPLLLPLGGCQLLGLGQKPPEPENEPVVADAFAVEFDSDGVERPNPRIRAKNGVAFHYVPADQVASRLAKRSPKRVFVIAHGWMNDTKSARDFTSQFVRGLLPRAEREGLSAEQVVFLGVHWDSEQINFFGSAETAEDIGRERLAGLLNAVAAAAPQARVLLIGHSLGARLVLAALQGSGGQGLVAGGAVLLEGAVNNTALLPGQDPTSFGAFPGAPKRASLLVNVHSKFDMVLEETYARIMQSPALGLLGAERQSDMSYPAFELTGQVDVAKLKSWLSVGDSSVPGAVSSRVINVDASAVVSGHSDVFGDSVLDLLWAASALAPPAR